MPNTLIHFCLQTPATRVLCRQTDFKWIAIGCIIPDIPWILQRIIPFFAAKVNLIDLRIYAVIQASLFFCLLFCLALSLLVSNRGRIFLLLSFNCFLHLLLDAMQTKWANGVHLMAPFSWQMMSFSFFWPEDMIAIVLSISGLVILLLYGYREWHKPVHLSDMYKNRLAALLLIVTYFVLPFFLFYGPERANSHYVGTLRNVAERSGKYIEFDRSRFRSSDKTVLVFSGERLFLKGIVPQMDGILSIKGNFTDAKTVQVESFHIHSIFRDIWSMVSLAIVMLIWLLAMAGKHITIQKTSS